jgi:hypothetical protein
MGGLPQIGDRRGFFYNVDEGFAATGVGCKSHEAGLVIEGARGEVRLGLLRGSRSTRNGAKGNPQIPTACPWASVGRDLGRSAVCLRLAPQVILVLS